MSRDRRDSPGSAADGASGKASDGDASGAGASELLTAYADGVAELAPDERRRVEDHMARDPAARAETAAVQSLLGRLRALPPGDAGNEPDWAAMERSIRHAVAAEPPRPWWRSWRWLVPALTCATAAAVLVVILPRPAVVSAPPRAIAHEPAAPAPEPAAGKDVVALWLDGSEVDVDLSAPDPLGPLGPLGMEVASAANPPDDPDEVGLLPATDLAWVDKLDDAALDRAERWLAGSGSTGAAGRKKI